MAKLKWHPYNTDNIKGKYLFRFLSEKRLEQFLKSGDLWFARSDKFGDKMECLRLSDLTAIPKPKFVDIKDRKQKHLICCFHESIKETLALWDTHSTNSDDRRKYALRFDRDQFINLIEQSPSNTLSSIDAIALTHGKVKYKTLIGNSPETLLTKTIKYVAFRKESTFSYEREYRFDILLKTKLNEDGINYNLGTPKQLDFKILVNPLLENSEYTQSIKKLNKLHFNNKFQQSVLAKWLKPDLW